MRTLSLLVALLAMPVGAQSLSPGGFTVTPTRITLSPKAPSAVLNLHNTSTTAARFEVKVFAWQEGANGEQQLTPTRDVIFFPTVFSVDGGQERVIRLAHTGGAATAEASYRMLVNQIPSAQTESTNGISSLLHLSLPVFFEPAKADPSGKLDLSLERTKLTIDVRNAGNIHLQARSIAITGTDANGALKYQQEFGGWYVLAGGHRIWQVEIPEDRCLALARVRVDVSGEYQRPDMTTPETFSGSVEVKPGSCRS